MGCLQSKTANVRSPDQESSQPDSKPDLGNGDPVDQDQVPAFKEFGLAELRAATNGFISELIVSESGEKAPNVVYRGKLRSNQLVAIKRFSKQSWPDAQQFVVEAAEVGKVRHKRLVNMIGCCAEGDERLLVAEYMPNDTLSKHLFHRDKQPLPWEMRLRVSYHIGQALDHCNSENHKIYHDLNAYRVLFDEVASHILMGLTRTPVVLPTMFSPLGKACARIDLTAVHDILLKTGYKDEEGADNELSFQEWTQQVQDMLNTKKFGDIAFRDKDFKNAIDFYSKLLSMMSVPSGTVFVRRAFSYLMVGQPELALRDAMQAQVCLPEWPTAFYMQALALSKLGMETDAEDMLNDGAWFETKKQNIWRS
ncbi:serine/threonine-protein kinase BSK2-like [Primulina huaijiensis]|uniref:serine/threonine-protein kinase BSK2-like n=1 Tax=Primulina huaijiensis TaxID=1492673 RepID=UPI003CC7850A